MFTHELIFKRAIEQHNELLNEAQTNRLAKRPQLRKNIATLLYKLADQLENPIAEPALRSH